MVLTCVEPRDKERRFQYCSVVVFSIGTQRISAIGKVEFTVDARSIQCYRCFSRIAGAVVSDA